MTSILVSVEGVLRNDMGEPLLDGEAIIRPLMIEHRVVFSSPHGKDSVEHYLRTRPLKGWAHVYSDGGLLEHLADERSSGHVMAVLTADTAEAREVFKQGITVLLCSASSFIRADWRPERKSWGEINA